MIGMEDAISRYDIKRAMRNSERQLSKLSSEDLVNSYGNDSGDETTLRKKSKAILSRNMKIAQSNQEFRDNNPCNHAGPDWYTFDDPNCYNQLDEVVVEGIDKSHLAPTLNSDLVKKNNWWNRPIDVSFKNPWPEARWDWFEDRQSGDFVWGPNRSGNEGRKQGINSKIYNSYQGDDLIPSGGGGNMKFWAHLDNWAKYGLKGVQTVTEAIEQAQNIDKAQELISQEQTSTVEALQITQFNSYKDVHGKLSKWVDSTKVKILLKGSPSQRLKLIDSIQRENDSKRGGVDYWLNQD